MKPADGRNLTPLRALALLKRSERALGSSDGVAMRHALADVAEALDLHLQAALVRKNRRRKR